MKTPELPYAFFTEEQKQYLDILVKFSGRTQRTRLVSSQAIPSKKYQFLKNNFILMTADEQYDFNQADKVLSEQTTIGALIGFGISAITMLYFVNSRPLHKKLYGEMSTSGILGLMFGLSFYQYHNYQYREKIHQMYVKLLATKKLGRI
ncbi:unnamed protein product (macronuclear) [Paramecium tetraurelia]|uniref:Uncharacterized protein n=1 Tax=Paramecium tetraurelia TaxID=5888 RepID=A0DXC7_PARTE|nr:uncharacterized protein GSPATT00021327001 [Paramecium tetraurelia]CAK87694.1 unnamed protein product [Paramecium tetraurelia]|eukprot:XP_001455091.1 hypothetical protein (macronuclear) [Paramecium tetraurelia strain d4-2]